MVDVVRISAVCIHLHSAGSAFPCSLRVGLFAFGLFILFILFMYAILLTPISFAILFFYYHLYTQKSI